MDDETLKPLDVIKRILRYHITLILSCLLLGVGAATVLLYYQEPRYTAQAVLIVGGTDVPASVAAVVDPKGAGPLGSDLPAESQARVLDSPLIADRVRDKLGLTESEMSAILEGVSAKAQTDDIFTVNADGPSAQAAIDYSNAFAAEYLAYRADQGKQLLSQLAEEAKARSQQLGELAAELDAAIATAIAGPEDADVSPLRTQQTSILTQARAANLTATDLEQFAATYNGGGFLITPASDSNVTSSPIAWRNIAFGGLLGLLVGLVAAAIADRISDRIRTRADAAAAAGADVVMAVRKGARGATAGSAVHAALAAAVLLSASRRDQRGGTVLIRAVSPKADALPIAELLRAALANHGRSSHLIAWDNGVRMQIPRTSGDLSEAHSQAVHNNGQVDDWTLAVASSTSAPGADFTWPSPGTWVLLVVRARHDRAGLVRAAARDIAIAGLILKGVVLVNGAKSNLSLGTAVESTRPVSYGMDEPPTRSGDKQEHGARLQPSPNGSPPIGIGNADSNGWDPDEAAVGASLNGAPRSSARRGLRRP